MVSKIHLIGNAHIDPAWLWRWQQGYAEIKATFRSVLDRMNEFPDFTFTSAGASYYKWVEENAPELFAEITARVKEGRWCVVGGMWNQPDCNIPSGESFARHFLLSQRYFIEKFGRAAVTGYNVDSFGHNASLPKILAAAGMKNYVMMRPDKGENPNMPNHAFWWLADDGSRILTYRIPNGYSSYIHGKGAFKHEYEAEKANDTINIADSANVPIMYFYGVGNHGGGPSIKSLNTLEELRQDPGGERFVYSSPDVYFNEICNTLNLPEWRGEMQHHASLCYSACSEIKRNNRRAENRLTSAEKYAVLSDAFTGYKMEKERMDKAWQNVLFNQFHDIMAGCSITEVFEDSRDVHGESLNIAAEVQNAAIQRLSWAVNTSVGGRIIRDKATDWQFWGQENLGTPILVFNPLAWDRTMPVQITKQLRRLTDDNDTDIPIQRVRASRLDNTTGKWDSIFLAKVPAMGWSLYWAYLGDFEDTVPEKTQVIENEYLRLEIDPSTGYINSLYDKTAKIEAFAGPAAVPLVVDVEHADTWGHNVFSFRNVVGRFQNANVTHMESGPVRSVIRVESFYSGSVLRQDFILYAGAKQLEARVRLDWREKFKLLKLSFPVNAKENIRAVSDVPFGHVTRPTDGLEESGQMWLDVGNEKYGVALLNDGKYSFDVLENDMRMTVANSSLFADHYGGGIRDGLSEHLDQGIQFFTYALVPHAGGWQNAGVVKAAIALNTETTHIAETYHDGPLPGVYRGIELSADNIVVTAVKPATDGTGVIVRAYESVGVETDVEINLLFLGSNISMRFKPYEIKTFKVLYDAKQRPLEVSLLEEAFE